MTEPLLAVENLHTYFFTEAGIVRAVEGVSFSLYEGEFLGLVGETGSGKSVTALSILRVVPKPGRIVAGRVLYRGQDLLRLSEEDMRRIRGRRIAMVFQDPNSSLDPLMKVGEQLMEVVRAHFKLSKKQAYDKAVSLLEMVQMPEPEVRMEAYPHELSGGMRQRAAIARALAAEPELLIADEPTTNVDVTVQAQIMALLKRLQRELGLSMILITHDMGLVAEMAQRVVVLYAGSVFEIAGTRDVFSRPYHPYTMALLEAVPRVDRTRELRPIPGNVPNMISPPTGCKFHPRCRYAGEICRAKVPELEFVDTRRSVACHFWREIAHGTRASS